VRVIQRAQVSQFVLSVAFRHLSLDELLDFLVRLCHQLSSEPITARCDPQDTDTELKATALILKRSSERWVKTSVAEAKKNTIDVRESKQSRAARRSPLRDRWQPF
jgi:hypothetical protein